MSYAGCLYYISNDTDTLTVGMVTHSVELFSQDLLDYLPGGNIVQAIAALFDALNNGIPLPSLNFVDVASAFPELLHDGLLLPRLSWMLTGVEDTVELAYDYRLQYVTGDVVYRVGQQSEITESTVTICRVVSAVYLRDEIETPLVVPVYPDGYKPYALDGGATLYYPKSTDYLSYTHYAATQYNPIPDSSLGFTEASLGYLPYWFDGQNVAESHVFSGQRDVSVEAVIVNGVIEYYIKSEGIGKGILIGNIPSPVPSPYTASYQSQQTFFSAVISHYIEGRKSDTYPPYYIPPGGGIPQEEFPVGGVFKGQMLSIGAAIGLLWLLYRRGGKL